MMSLTTTENRDVNSTVNDNDDSGNSTTTNCDNSSGNKEWYPPRTKACPSRVWGCHHQWMVQHCLPQGCTWRVLQLHCLWLRWWSLRQRNWCVHCPKQHQQGCQAWVRWDSILWLRRSMAMEWHNQWCSGCTTAWGIMGIICRRRFWRRSYQYTIGTIIYCSCCLLLVFVEDKIFCRY